MLRAHFESLSDRDERYARRAKTTKIREQIERRAAPTIEALDDHDVDRATLCSIEDAIETRPNAAATRSGLLDLEHDAQSARGSCGAELAARESRILLASADAVIERGPKTLTRGHASEPVDRGA